MRTRLLAALAAIAVLAVLFAGLPDAVRVAVKALPCLCMAWIAWEGQGPRSVRIGVTFALLFSTLGDVILEVPDRPDLFVPGLAAFLLAHLAYIGAFASDERLPRWPWLAVVLAGTSLVWWTIRPGLGDLLVPVTAYFLVITTMVWRAAAWGERGGPAGAAAIFGAALFAVSDSIIGYTKFVAPLPASNFLILSTYFVAQAALTSTAALPPPPPRPAPAPR